MSYIYAELDENNICKAVSELSGEVIKDTMIPLETYDTSLLGKRYDNGEWVEVPVEPPETILEGVINNTVDILQHKRPKFIFKNLFNPTDLK